jgi:hypothetical protein
MRAGAVKRVGTFKVRVFRVMQYASLITAPSIILTGVKVYGLRWYWGLLALPPILLAYWVDPKIQSGESQYGNDNNEDFQGLLKDIREIKETVKRLEGK